MNAGAELLLILFNLVLTAFLYSIGPLLLAFMRKKPILLSRLRLFSWIYSAAVFLFFAAMLYAGGEASGPNATAAFFWGFIAYRLAKKKLRGKGVLTMPEDPVLPPDPPVEAVDYSSTLNEYTFIVPGEKKSEPQKTEMNATSPQSQVVGIQANVRGPIVASVSEPVLPVSASKKGSGLKVFSVIIALLLVASVAYSVFLHLNLQEVNAALSDSNEEIRELKVINAALEKESENARAAQITAENKISALDAQYSAIKREEFFLKFALKRIGYIYEGYRNYHYYDCSAVTNADTYWAHNIEYCEYLGYDPCPICWNDVE